MCGFCVKYFNSLKKPAKGLFILFCLMIYHLFSFMALLSLGIGLSYLIGQLYEYCMSPSQFPDSVEAFMCMYFVTLFSEIHIFCQRECIGNAMLVYDRIHRNILVYGRLLIYISLYIFAFGQLYIQFEAVHLSKRDAGERKRLGRESASEAAPLEETGHSWGDKTHTAIFLLALSFLLYCTSKIIQYDIIEQLKRVHTNASCVHCVVTFAYFGLHLLINVLYAIPLFIVALSLKMYGTSGALAFVEINAVAVISGVVFAVTETRRPWPTQKALRPFYLYENNTRAKFTLGQVQVMWILITFYNPNESGKIASADFNAGNQSVVAFCVAVGFNVIHFVKQLVFIWLNIQQDPAGELQPPGDPNDPIDPVQDVAIVIPNEELELIRPNRYPSDTNSFCDPSETNNNDPQVKDDKVPTSDESQNNNSKTEGNGQRTVTRVDLTTQLFVNAGSEMEMRIEVLGSGNPSDMELKKSDPNSFCTQGCIQTNVTQTRFLKLGIEEEDSDLNLRSNQDQTPISLVVGNISEDDVQVIRTLTLGEVETVDPYRSGDPDLGVIATLTPCQDDPIIGHKSRSKLASHEVLDGVDSNSNVEDSVLEGGHEFMNKNN